MNSKIVLAVAAGVAVVAIGLVALRIYFMPRPAPAVAAYAIGPANAPVLTPAADPGTGPSSSVTINDRTLSAQEIAALGGGGIPPGAYWYDPVSGFWGHRGMPVEGQIMPGLNLGGPLRPDASNGNTGVFINGRELTVVEVVYLSQQGPVMRGRWWMNAQGVFGAEGGPAIGQVRSAAASGGRRPSLSERGELFRPGEIINGR